jgi:hypothetical protein
MGKTIRIANARNEIIVGNATNTTVYSGDYGATEAVTFASTKTAAINLAKSFLPLPTEVRVRLCNAYLKGLTLTTQERAELTSAVRIAVGLSSLQ